MFTGDYVRTLYGLTRGSYDERFGSLELERIGGAPQVFVIGGGGSGIALYRRLQRQGIPFAAGVLHEGGLDEPVARALAAETVFERAYQPIGDAALERARALMAQCGRVCCPQMVFGPMNEKNRLLRDEARANGWLTEQV